MKAGARLDGSERRTYYTIFMKLYLIRGPAGTGKSTIGANIANKSGSAGCSWSPWFETDQFFMLNGVYKFDISKLKIAHQWNQLRVEHAMFHGADIVCTNTFIALWELEHYLELAEQYKYEVTIIRSPGPWSVENSASRNKHSVPPDVIKRHINSYQPHHNEIEWTDLSIFNT
mgnify:FL=1